MFGIVVWEISGHCWGVFQSNYCASDGAFLFSFVYAMYLNISSYLYGKQIKSEMGNKLYLRMIYICVRLNRLDLHDCPTMTLRREAVVKLFLPFLDKILSDPLVSLSIQSYFRWHYLFTFGHYYRIYICIWFWRFNLIIMTRTKWLVFTKSMNMGMNNISHWPCPLGIVCLPCVLHDSIQHLSSSCRSLVKWYDSHFAWRRSLVRDAHNAL